jgi:hypothetical protein
MSINHQYFNSAFNFDVTVKSLLLGFTRPENAKIASCTNVVVVGTTEASASAYVANILKAKNTNTVRCVGVDSKPSSLRGHGFSGYIVMLPELQYVGNSFITSFVDLFEVLETANLGTTADGDYKDLQILFANRSIEAAFFGAMFERWKNRQNCKYKWHIDGDEPKYMVGLLAGSAMPASEYLGYGDEADYKDADPEFRIAPPIQMDLGKVVSELLVPGREHYRVSPAGHPIRFGREFISLSAEQIYTMLYKFEALEASGAGRRTLCIHDDIAKKLFLSNIRPDVCVGSVYSSGECGSQAPAPVFISAQDMEIELPKKSKAKSKTVATGMKLEGSGSITLTTPGETVVNT